MKKYIIINILMLLLSSTAVLSCSAGLSFDKDSSMYFSMSISGTVSDKENGKALENITVSIVTSFHNEENVYSKTVDTDNNGNFTILLDGYRKPSTIIATAEDKNGTYDTISQDILITWDDVSYNTNKEGIYYINRCDFYMEKK